MMATIWGLSVPFIFCAGGIFGIVFCGDELRPLNQE